MDVRTARKIYHSISLEHNNESFTARAPHERQEWRIRLIHVSHREITLYGDRVRRDHGGLLPMPYVFGFVSEIKGMPFSVAQKVQECLDWFEKTKTEGFIFVPFVADQPLTV